TRATASAVLLPVPSPRRLKPPQPRPATLTLSPVRPSVAYSMRPPDFSGSPGAPDGEHRGRRRPDDQTGRRARHGPLAAAAGEAERAHVLSARSAAGRPGQNGPRA